MSYLLDTCVLSELVRPRPDPRVMAWIEASDETRMHLSVLTLGELAKGVARLPTSAKRKRLQAWLERDLLARFAERIVPIDHAVATRWGELQAGAERRGRPMPVIDGLIAATAVVHELTVVTRNGDDIAESGVALLDPWRS